MKYYYKIKEKSIFILTAIVFTLFFYAGTDICCADEENINPDQCIISSGFEESYDFSVWKPFGSDTAKLEADSSKSHSGNYSLKISGRNSSYEGPSVSLNDITEAGDTYHVSVWFSYSGESPDSMRLSLKESFSDKKDKFTTIASQDNVNPDQWIKIEGDEFVCISKRPFRDDLLKYIDAAEKSSYEYPFSIAAGFSSYKSGTDGEIPDIKQMITRCDKEMYKNKTEKKSNKK